VRRVAAAITSLVLLLFAAPTPASAQDRPAATLSLASQTAWVAPGSPFTIRLDVDGVRRPQDLELDVRVHRAVRTRSQFARTIDGELLGASVHDDSIPFDELRFDPGGAVPVQIDLPSLRAGVYPVSVALVDTRAEEPVAFLVTHLVKVDDEPSEIPLNVAWVQPYGADPALQPDGTVELDDDALDGLRTVAAQLDAGVPLTVTPTPETIAALASIDEGRTTDALAELLAEHQVLSTPFVDLDIPALVAARREADINHQRLVGDQVLSDILGVRGDVRTWSVTGAVTRSALRALTDLGVRQLVLDETALEPLDADATGGVTLARPYAIDGPGGLAIDAVSVDPGLVAHFDNRDEVLGAHHLLADLAVLHLDAPGTNRAVAIRPPADWEPSEVFLGTALGNIATSPLLRPVTVDALFDTVDPLLDAEDEPLVRGLAESREPELGYAPEAIDEARGAIEGLGSLLVDRTSADLDLFERLLLVAQSVDLRATARDRYVVGVRERVGAAASRVQAVGNRTYRLTAREGTIPLTLVNDNDFAVQVDIELTSDKLTFTDSDDPGRLLIRGLVLEANRTTTAAVPVKTRASGAFPLRVTLRSPDGRLELGATRYTITSTVASGVGLVLSVGAGAFLLVWWASHWRKVARARRLVAADA
jgi:hypothetical protein